MPTESALELLPQQQKKADAPKAVDEERYLTISCQCGKKCGCYLRHYERVRCACDRVYWALRPKRNGPMQLWPWPGDPRMLTPAPEK